MKPIIIFGSGEYAEVAHFYFTRDAGRVVAGFALDSAYITQDTCLGLPVYSFETLATTHAPSDYELFLAIGYSQVNRLRKAKFYQAKQKGYRLASYLSSKAVIWTQDIGEHCFVLEHNTIQPFSRIGHNCILWSGNHIGHHSQIEDHAFITSHAVIAGAAVIGEGSFVGINATIRDRAHIGKHNVIGAGVTILSHTQDDMMYKAEMPPARIMPNESVDI